MTFEECDRQLAILLRGQPPSVSAELAAYVIAFWNGQRVVYCFLREDGSGEIDEEFNPTAYLWEDQEPDFTAWLGAPRFGVRPELMRWPRRDAPSDTSP